MEMTAKRARIKEALTEYEADLRTDNPNFGAFFKAMEAGVSKTALFRAAKERDKLWDRQSHYIILRLQHLLTPQDHSGRDLCEAIDNIDAFEFAEDIEALCKIHEELNQVSLRAAKLADKLRQALQTKGKPIDAVPPALPAPEDEPKAREIERRF